MTVLFDAIPIIPPGTETVGVSLDIFTVVTLEADSAILQV
jgi:hypothetical protein